MMPTPPYEFLTAEQLAEKLRMSTSTLAKWRVFGGGPPYTKLGRRVVYRSDHLQKWLDDRVRRHTSE